MVIASSLREIAEARLVANPSTEFADLSVEELLHELRVKQTEREILDQEMRESGAQLRSFVQQAPAALAMFDRNMIYLAASQYWTSSFGGGRSDIVGLNADDVLTDMPDRWKEANRKGLAGEAQSCDEDLWLRADGSRVWLRWSLRPWLDAEGNIGGIMSMAEDITLRMKVQEALRENEERFHSLFESMHEGFFLVEVILDIKGNPDDCRIVEVNSACEKMIGFKRADVVGRPYQAAFPGREETWHAALMHTALTGEPASFERFSTITGRWYAIRLYSPAPKQCAAIYDEITARKMVEEEVRNNADELSRFNQAAVDRELRMIELKKEVNRLCAQAGLLPRYAVEFDQEQT